MKRVRSTCASPNLSLAVIAFVALMGIVCKEARAVPSFSRQTALSCSVCHSNPPELTAFGRRFKLDGYTLADKAPDANIADRDLTLPRAFPLSVMLLLSDTSVNGHMPGAQSANAGFPQALSLFLAGRVAPHLGAFVQATYSHQDDHVTLDNADIRYATHTTLGAKDLLCGMTLNNSPSVEDVWNSTPSWGYPWLSSGSSPSPAAAPLIFGGLAQDVAGLGGYTMWNDHLYAGVTLYRSEHAGGPQPLTGTGFPFNIDGVAPYWRLAWQETLGLNYLELGTYGIHVSSIPFGVSGAHDKYSDIGFDLQYERPYGVDLLTVHATYVRESSTLDGTLAAGGAATSAHELRTLRADATYHLRRRYTFSLGAFSTTGSVDPILFAPAPVTGSLRGSPDSSGFTVQTGFWPAQNVALTAAYTGYATFNGASRNYDGFGRSAAANNALYVALWLNF